MENMIICREKRHKTTKTIELEILAKRILDRLNGVVRSKLCLFLILLIINTLGYCSDMNVPLTATLDIKILDQKVFAYLAYKNISEKSFLVDKYKLALDGELTTRAFKIQDADGNNIPYTGAIVKRKPNPNDFVKIEPGQVVSIVTNLNKFYDFPITAKIFKIYFNVFDPFDGLNDMYEITSNATEFELLN